MPPVDAENALQNSMLIVAHPDDEILWFGSIAPHVDKIVICFSHDPAHPELSEARARTLERHPWAERIVSLGLDETGAFGHAAWPRPAATEFGLEIIGSGRVSAGYQSTARQLRQALSPLIAAVDNVFTHNPWGEYGHEEHVMVHRVAATLAEETGKATWFDNYASSWSSVLMYQYFDRTSKTMFSADVNVNNMMSIADIYREEAAWTWFDDYAWFGTEHFVRGPLDRRSAPDFGWMFPVNYVGLPDRDLPDRSRKRPGFLRRIRRRLTRSGASHG